jgi:hypothetical protein
MNGFYTGSRFLGVMIAAIVGPFILRADPSSFLTADCRVGVVSARRQPAKFTLVRQLTRNILARRPVFSGMKTNVTRRNVARNSSRLFHKENCMTGKVHRAARHSTHIRINWLCAGVLLGAAAGSLAAQTKSAPSNNYLVHNLVSDLANTGDHQDPHLVNPWGVGFGSTPFWSGNSGTGTATLYDGTGALIPLVVTIPQAGNAGTAGPITGVIFNPFASNPNAFDVQARKPALFIFCSKDGVISGWNQSVSGAKASVLFDNSKSGAVYTGCAVGGPPQRHIFTLRTLVLEQSTCTTPI